jgi:hypothetical protein
MGRHIRTVHETSPPNIPAKALEMMSSIHRETRPHPYQRTVTCEKENFRSGACLNQNKEQVVFRGRIQWNGAATPEVKGAPHMADGLVAHGSRLYRRRIPCVDCARSRAASSVR